ncbi:MAG TPA: hypothetical protein VIJ94_06565 [Caulobacteraceae bacterium]
MPAKSTAQPALDDAIQAVGSAAGANFDSTLDDLKDRAGRASRAAQDTYETLRNRAGPYLDDAGDRWAVAERYLVDRVQKQPLTTTFAVLGVGVLVGLILAGGRSR